MRPFLFCGLMAMAFGVQAQEAVTHVPVPLHTVVQDTVPVYAAGDVKMTFGPGVEGLLKGYAERKHPVDGFRVQIFLGDRVTAESTKRTFLQKHPDVPAYLSWLAPNFRLRVGDLRTRLEAERMLRDMKVLYPGSYIVPDVIEMPRLD